MSLTEISPTLLTDAWRHITRYLCPILCSFEHHQQSKIIGYKLSMYSQCCYYFRKDVLPQYVDYVKVTRLYPTFCDTMAFRLLCPWNSPGEYTGVSCHSLLQGIFPTQRSNPGLLHWKADSLPSEPPGKHKSKCLCSKSSF